MCFKFAGLILVSKPCCRKDLTHNLITCIGQILENSWVQSDFPGIFHKRAALTQSHAVA